MEPRHDYQLGCRLAERVAAAGAEAFESGRCSRRISSAVPDLLGAETSLATPLADLVRRPGFALLFSPGPRSQRLGHRDALLADLHQLYSPAMVQRLAAVLNGCLGEAPGHAAAPPAAAAATAGPGRQGNPGVTDRPLGLMLIPLLSLLGGALLVGVVGLLVLPRHQLRLAAPLEQAPGSAIWDACRIENARDPGAPPQPGDIWWPVVGPRDVLADARLRCRADAFVNRSGNVQVSSFRDRETATRFAERLSADGSQPYRFWVGEPSQR